MLYPNQKPKASHEEDRDNWPEVDQRKRSASEADRRRGSELDDGGDVDNGRAGNVKRVSLRDRSELDDGGDIKRVELERNERWTRESENESEWMTGFDKMNKK